MTYVQQNGVFQVFLGKWCKDFCKQRVFVEKVYYCDSE